jgi:CheY-like chemotaxis protein
VSLSGSLQDLPLFEILQVVTYTGKTGYLTITTPDGEAGVVFRAGCIVSAYVWDVPSLPAGPPAGPDHEARVQSRIASVLERLVRLHDGDFAFNLTDAVPRRLGGRDLTGETLTLGLNAEEQMLDLARQLDESRKSAVAVLEASLGAPDLDDVVNDLPPEEPVVPDSPGSVLLVDDEADVVRVIGERLRAAGLEVREASGLDGARQELERLGAGGGRFQLVVDLGLPSATGNTFRGGLDVLRLASRLLPAPPAVLMAESLDAGTRARARRLGASLVVFKPGLSKLDRRQYEADLRAFGDTLAEEVLPRLGGRDASASPAGRPPPPRQAADEEGRASVLTSALEEIESSPDPDLVSFLLLRAARSFFPRVILFVVKDESLHGLSGFGPLDSGDSLDLLVRELTVPLDEPSPFEDAVARGEAWEGPLPTRGPLHALLNRIGRLDATSAAVVPVRAERETIAVLYGDAPGGDSLPPLRSFVTFVERAGRALEESLRLRGAAGGPAA